MHTIAYIGGHPDWLKCQWREENFLKYARGNYGTGKTCDYAAEITVSTNPATQDRERPGPRRGQESAIASVPSQHCSPTRTLRRPAMVLRLLARNAEH